ncbi:MAG TPA: hypothetical protein VMR88_15870 [Candidatus Polarisedimenticolaceae bacterium]|nr:hypothetical protein [Candidatus Polarisedimenticolaceae bacterium]
MVANETLLVDRGGGVRNAVVILRPLHRTVNVHPGRIVLDNKQCAFTPHVQIAATGSELILKAVIRFSIQFMRGSARRRFLMWVCPGVARCPKFSIGRG